MADPMERRTLDGREVWLCGAEDAPTLLVQPVDDHDLEGLASEAGSIAALAPDVPFRLAAFRVRDWNGELSPWPAPPVFGREPFGGGAGETLAWVREGLLPALGAERFRSVCIGGYSLAGLFALYAAWACDDFDGAAGASPSVWFPGWLEFARATPPWAKHVYLSLGDREERARNAMHTVGDNIRATHARLREIAVDTLLEWNPGNHFREPDLRTAKGFAWLLRRLAEA